VADEIFADFVSKEVDKVELVFTKFVSLIASDPVIQTLLPLTPTGELCDVDGNCVDAAQARFLGGGAVSGHARLCWLSF
jgi:F-type H+-transporting ATPase subunit gamma